EITCRRTNLTNEELRSNRISLCAVPLATTISSLVTQMISHIEQKKILIIEDSEDFRSLSVFWLKSAGFDIAEAANGHEALFYLQHHPLPALIVLDIQMPVMNGW